MADIDRTAGVESVDVARAELAAARTESGVKTWARKALLGVTTALAISPVYADETQTDETIQLASAETEADDLLAGMLDDANTEGEILSSRIAELEELITNKLKSNPHLVPTVDALIKDVERLKAENADRLVTIAKLEEAGRLLGINV